MHCIYCGERLEKDAKFCTACGSPVPADQQEAMKEAGASTLSREKVENEFSSARKSFVEHMGNSFNHATEKINPLIGEEGGIDLNVSDVFSDVFKKHAKEEAELIFISGTTYTTPKESDIQGTWPKPWLFSRIFLTLALTFFFLFIAMDLFQNGNAIPGLIVVGAFAVPFSLLIFFWEMNAPRNISFYENAIMFFVGGAASLPTTLVLYSVFPIYDLTISSAIIIGVIEEVGKLAIIIYFIHRINPKYILNGLLIGAAIGAGFAAFESAGYAFTYQSLGIDQMVSITFLRAWTGIGTHTVWSAIAGAALVYVKKDAFLSSSHIFSKDFLKLFAVSMGLHAVWDMPLFPLQNFYFQYIALIIIAWIVVFVLINAGLKQIVRLNTYQNTPLE